MDLNEKIEQIRKQPEHIRMRWVWGLTALFMLGVVFIWFLSLKSLSGNAKNELEIEKKEEIIDEFQKQKQSIKDVSDEISNAIKTPPVPPSSPDNLGNEKSPSGSGEGFSEN